MLSASEQHTQNSPRSSESGPQEFVNNFINSIFGVETPDLVADMAMTALKDGNLEVAGWILTFYKRRGLEPNFCKKLDGGDGKTLLHYLAMNSSNSAVQDYILNIRPEKDIDCNIQDDEGNTPAHYALAYGKHNLVCFFEMLGCNLGIANKKGVKIVRDDTPATFDVSIPEVKTETNLVQSDVPSVFSAKQTKLGQTGGGSVESTIDFDRNAMYGGQNVRQTEDVDAAAIAQRLIDSVSNKQQPAQAGGRRKVSGSRSMLTFSEKESESDTLRQVERISSRMNGSVRQRVSNRLV